jgi:hypothetical protein
VVLEVWNSSSPFFRGKLPERHGNPARGGDLRVKIFVLRAEVFVSSSMSHRQDR